MTRPDKEHFEDANIEDWPAYVWLKRNSNPNEIEKWVYDVHNMYNQAEFTVKDSWEREEFETGARRDTNEWKPRYDLISPFALKRLAEHMAKWAEKYWEHNREKWIPSTRCYESAIRHLMQFSMWDRSEDHLSAVLFNVMAIIHFQETPPLLNPKF